jgi:transcriptional regulator with XRE-family HTH domain
MGDDGYLAKWVGRNLAAARQARELSRRDAAALIGTTPEYLAQLERGQRNATFRAVERAGDALGVEAVLGLDNADLFRDPADFARVLGAVTAGHRQTTDEGR